MERLGIGKARRSIGKYPAAVEAFRRALAAAEFTNAGEHKLAGIYDANAGQYAAAEHQYRRALTLVEKTRGRQSID
ncbi:MAG: hypothetical protein JWP08_3305 [Bryobacterales bacterium]|nr:hypothetical protein [Bryobacterales bacterium]